MSSLELSVIVEVGGLGGNESLVLLLGLQIDGGLGGHESGLLDQSELVVLGQLAKEVDEGLVVVVVGLDGDLVVCERLTAVISNLLGGNLTLSHVHLVTAQYHWDVGAHTVDITMPVRDVFVGDAISYVEHDDRCLASNVVTLAQPYRVVRSVQLAHQQVQYTITNKKYRQYVPDMTPF